MCNCLCWLRLISYIVGLLRTPPGLTCHKLCIISSLLLSVFIPLCLTGTKLKNNYNEWLHFVCASKSIHKQSHRERILPGWFHKSPKELRTPNWGEKKNLNSTMHKYSLASTGMLMIGFYYFSEQWQLHEKTKAFFYWGKRYRERTEKTTALL